MELSFKSLNTVSRIDTSSLLHAKTCKLCKFLVVFIQVLHHKILWNFQKFLTPSEVTPYSLIRIFKQSNTVLLYFYLGFPSGIFSRENCLQILVFFFALATGIYYIIQYSFSHVMLKYGSANMLCFQ